jgi:hypothetical protein
MDKLIHEANELLTRLVEARQQTYNSTMEMGVYKQRMAQLRRLIPRSYQRLCRRLDLKESIEHVNHLFYEKLLAEQPDHPWRKFAPESVSSAIAAMYIQRHLDAGGSIEIPSLGITLGGSKPRDG